jgi:hypothetical protein
MVNGAYSGVEMLPLAGNAANIKAHILSVQTQQTTLNCIIEEDRQLQARETEVQDALDILVPTTEQDFQHRASLVLQMDMIYRIRSAFEKQMMQLIKIIADYTTYLFIETRIVFSHYMTVCTEAEVDALISRYMAINVRTPSTTGASTSGAQTIPPSTNGPSINGASTSGAQTIPPSTIGAQTTYVNPLTQPFFAQSLEDYLAAMRNALDITPATVNVPQMPRRGWAARIAELGRLGITTLPCSAMEPEDNNRRPLMAVLHDQDRVTAPGTSGQTARAVQIDESTNMGAMTAARAVQIDESTNMGAMTAPGTSGQTARAVEVPCRAVHLDETEVRTNTEERTGETDTVMTPTASSSAAETNPTHRQSRKRKRTPKKNAGNKRQ